MMNHTMLDILAEDVNVPEITYPTCRNDKPATGKRMSKTAKKAAAAVFTAVSLLTTFFTR